MKKQTLYLNKIEKMENTNCASAKTFVDDMSVDCLKGLDEAFEKMERISAIQKNMEEVIPNDFRSRLAFLPTKIDYKKSLCDKSRTYIIKKFLLPLCVYREPENAHKIVKMTSDQEKVLNAASFSGECVVTKGRCCGFTTLLQCKIAADIILAEKGEISIFFSGYSFHTTKIFLEGLDNLLSLVPDKLWTEEENIYDKRTEVDWTKGELTFKNGIKLYILDPVRRKDTLNKLEKAGDFRHKNFVYLDEFFFSNSQCEENSSWKDYVECIERLKNDFKIDYCLIGSSPNNNDPEAFDYLKEKNKEGKRIHMFPMDQAGAMKKIQQNNGYEPFYDEVLGVIKKTEVLSNNEQDWLKGIKEKPLS